MYILIMIKKCTFILPPFETKNGRKMVVRMPKYFRSLVLENKWEKRQQITDHHQKE